MNRKIKNIIMISIILIVGFLSFLTMNDAKNNISNPFEMPENRLETNQNGEKIAPPNQENKEQGENQDFRQISKPSEQKQDFMPETRERNNNIQTSYYVLFGMEAFIISLLLVYLCMSNFNKKTFRETISKTNKTVIYIALVIILTVVLTYLQALLTKNVFIANNKVQFQDKTMQMPENTSLNNKNV